MKKRDWITVVGAGIGAFGSYLLARAYIKKREICPPFQRKMYGESQELVETFGLFWENPAALKSLKQNERLGHPFVEKLLLTISGAHGMRSKKGLAATHGMRAGLSAEDVGSLLQGQVVAATQEEAPALVFAREYAERGGDPDLDLLGQMVDHYGPATARDIVTSVRLMRAVSLLGNTWDAFCSRLLGQPAPGSTLKSELSTLCTFAFGVLPLLPVLAFRIASSEPLGEPLSQEAIVLSD